MASDAEVDLVVNASRALTDVQRDLNRLVTQAENTAPDVTLAAVLDQTVTLRQVERDLEGLVRRAQEGASDIDLDATLNQLAATRQLRRQLDFLVNRAEATAEPIDLTATFNTAASLRNVRNELDEIARRARTDIDVDIDIDEDRFNDFRRHLDELGDTGNRTLATLGRLSVGVGGLGAAVGTSLPLVAGLVATIQNIVPATAVATQGMLAMQLASGTLKLGMLGVADAVEAAFDPDAKPEELAEAMEKLAPEAREFVEELVSMRGAFDQLRIDTQNTLFQDLSGHLRGLAARVMPVVRDAVRNTADVLNDMAKGAANAAGELGENGTLRTALEGSVRGLRNLEQVPGQVTTAFGQLAAASAPAFARITAAVARLSTEISERLTAAFESGRLEEAINNALELIKRLGAIGGNFLTGLRNIIGSVTTDSDAFIGTLERLSQTFEDLTASTAVQEFFGALSFALGAVARALAPVIEFAGFLIENVLPILTPLLEDLGEIFEKLTPLIDAVAQALEIFLAPILEELAEQADRFLDPLIRFIDEVSPKLVAAVKENEPELRRLGIALADLLEAAAPLIERFLLMSGALLEELLPAINKVLPIVIDFVELGLNLITETINNFVIPALEILSAVMNGDFSGAFKTAGGVVQTFSSVVTRVFAGLVTAVTRDVNSLASRALGRLNTFYEQWKAQTLSTINTVGSFFARLPGRILSALGNLGSLLFDVGADIIDGLIAGLNARVGGLLSRASDIASDIASTIRGALDIRSPSRVMADIGDDIVAGLTTGIARSVPDLRRAVNGLALTIPSTAAGAGALATPVLNAASPVVNVYLGTEQLSRFVDFRVFSASRTRDIQYAQGVRR